METGRLLLAVPGMLDPHFDASVVLMFAEAEGDAGVVLNRPTDVPLSAALPAWAATPSTLSTNWP
ncbi:MAG: YqgE/AlgH family protein, partial [Thermoanaerobaculia bacterium]